MRSAVLLLLTVSCAGAIVFVPPAIYVVTLSVGAFLTNAMLFVAAWLAFSGLLDRRFFGKKPHELVRCALSFMGRAFVFLSCALLSVLIVSPVTPVENMQAAAVSGAAAFCLLFLGSFRVLLVAEGKGKKIYSLTLCALLAAGGTYLSIALAQETKVIHTNGAYEKKDMALSAPSIADMANEIGSADLSIPKIYVPSGYLFYPQGPGACSIFYRNESIKTITPTYNCYYYENGRSQRVYCPVDISLEDLPDGKGILAGRGSCMEVYDVK
jgi:hypothetical protein